MAVAAAACGGSAPPNGSSTTPPTTTLPVATKLPSSGPGGAYSSLGAFWRIPVAQVREGRLVPLLRADGSLGPSEVIGYRQFGSGSDLLLISGEHASMTSWDPQFLLDLAAHFRVTMFDLPDVGYSAPDAKFDSVSSLADFTAGLIWALGLSQTTVVGWGLGGEVALSLAERHSGLVHRLVLADATAGGRAAARPAAAVSALMSSPFTTPIELSRVLFPTSAAAARIAWLSNIDSVYEDAITAGAIVRQANLVAATYHSEAVAKLLGKIVAPTVIFAGAEDVVVPPANATQLQRAIPRARLVVLGGAGYAAIFQDASTFIADLAGS